jgi:hypothetical protein
MQQLQRARPEGLLHRGSMVRASDPPGAQFLAIEVRFTAEVPSSLGVRSSRELTESWFQAGAPAHLHDKLREQALRPPGSFLTDFFYSLEDEFLPEPWTNFGFTAAGQILPFERNTVLGLDPARLNNSQTLYLPISAFGCSLANASRPISPSK